MMCSKILFEKSHTMKVIAVMHHMKVQLAV